MPKGPPPQWNRRDCRFDYLVEAALAQGYGRVLILKGIETWDRADDIRRGVYRCARHRGISSEAGPNFAVDEHGEAVKVGASEDQMGIRKVGKTFEFRFRVWPKTYARKAHLQRHGTDRANWPYDPRRPSTDEERESWANRDEQGKIVRHA